VWEPWIRFHLTTNTGAAWSIFAGNSFALSFVSVAIAALLLWVWLRNFRYHFGMTLAVGAIIGGALGNSIDRFRLREVVDFMAVKIPWIGRLFPRLGDPYDFPIFNVADACAVCGTIALAGYLLWLDLGGAKRNRARTAAVGATSTGFKPFPGGLQLDDEAKQNLRALDTHSVENWKPTERAETELQEAVGADRADAAIRDAHAAEQAALTSDYAPTASALEVSRREDTVSAEAAVNTDTDVVLPDPGVDVPPARGDAG
jgi:signal peptidase II